MPAVKEIIEFLASVLSGTQQKYEEELEQCISDHYLMPAEKILERGAFGLDLEALINSSKPAPSPPPPPPAAPDVQMEEPEEDKAVPVTVPEHMPDEVKPEPSPPSKPPRSAHFPSLVLSDLQADILERLPDHAFESSLAFARTRVWSALSMV